MSVGLIEGPEQRDRTLPVVGVTDTSGSMHGAKMQSVNAALRNAIPELRKLQAETPGVNIDFQVIAFDDVARKIYPDWTNVDDLSFIPLEVGTYSNLGAGLTLAREELEALERKGGLYMRPIIIVLSDGAVHDWETPFQLLLANKMGKASQRICFAIGEDADKGMLAQIKSADQDIVYEVNDAASLCAMIIMASVVGAENASKGRSTVVGDNPRGFQVPEVDKSLIPDSARVTNQDIAQKFGVDPEATF